MKKKLYDMYLISRKFPKGVFTSKEILQIFGYSEKTKIQNIYGTLSNFIIRHSYEQPKHYWYILDLAAVPEYLVPENCFGSISIKGPKKKKLFLVPRNLVPFYLLKEFGGNII